MGRALATLGAVAVFAAGIGVGAAVTGPSDPGGAGPRDRGPVALPDGLDLVGALTSFDGCDDYLAYVRQHALEEVTAYGLGGGFGRFGGVEMVGDGAARAEAVEDTSAEPAAGSAGTTPLSGTNVQEAGVDEPDRIKTDGRTAYVVTEGRLRIVDITGDEPRQLASVDLRDAWDAQLLLDGDRLLIASRSGAVIPFPGEPIADIVPWGGATTTLTLLDVSDPADPVVDERLVLDGATLSSRMVDGVARVVIRTEPGVNLPWVTPEAGGLRAERAALEANRDLIRGSTAADWLPYYLHQTRGGRDREGSLVGCNRVAHPTDYAGLGTLSILTVDVSDGRLLPDAGTIGVLAGGDTVYASPERLYVATTRWLDPAERDDAARSDLRRPGRFEVTTELHAFDIADPHTTRYLASGSVDGNLLSQWAMSEHEGILRVASTVGDLWWGGGGDEVSESFVTTLRLRGDELVEVGKVGELGPTERIYAVRFLGEVGYVVTFRQTDPLYTVDLSDPARPWVTGELKIDGYSAYLHPIGDGLLIGVGQDATDDGRTLGTQVSLFDVADPTDPRRIDQITVPDSASAVEHDHKAFLHWPTTGLTVVPVSRWWIDECCFDGDRPGPGKPDGPPNGALAFTAGRDGFAPVAGGDLDALALTHAQVAGDADARYPWDAAWDAAIDRAVVVGDRLLTFSAVAIGVHDLDDLSERGRLRF